MIKRIRPDHNTNSEFLTTFRDEARITSQLHHGNIVQVIEFGRENGQHYLVLEYVEGVSLQVVLAGLRNQDTLMSIPEAAFVTSEIARALDYAHRKKSKSGEPLMIVHRDVSTSNILISCEGEVKLADFGIARARARLLPNTEAGMLKGKLSYTAPEALSGGDIDFRFDLFALGVVAYEMFTGMRPFHADTQAATIVRLLAGHVEAPSKRRPALGPDIDAIVLGLLATDPLQRPSRGLEVAEAFASRRLSEHGSPNELLAQTVRLLLNAPRSPDPREPPERPLVLIVDQSRTMRALLKSKLSGRFQVIEAASAAEAVVAVCERLPRAIVCERTLPDGTGLELCASLQRESRLETSSFVLIAADVTDELETQAISRGARAVMRKAVDALELEHALTLLIEASGQG